MVRTINAAVASGKKKPIAFKTKDGKAIEFKSGGVKKAKAVVRVKQLEKRLSAMEKAVMKYNHDVKVNKEVKEKKVKLDKDASAGTVATGSGGAGQAKTDRGSGVKGCGVGGNGGKIVGHAGVKKI
jgi:hypothetical protein